MSGNYQARVVGRVYGRDEALAFVAGPSGVEVRVRWRNARCHKGPAGFFCAEHGRLDKASGCAHALAASVALRWQRKAEREALRGGEAPRSPRTPVPPGRAKRSARTNQPQEGGRDASTA